MSVVDPLVNTHLCSVLQSVQQTFLNAIADGPESLAAFHQSWADLRQSIATAQVTRSLDERTTSLAHTVAQDIAVIGKSFLDVELATSACSSRLTSEWQTMINTQPQQTKNSSGKAQSRTSTRSPSPQFHRTPKPSLQRPRHPTTTPITSALVGILPSRTPSCAASITDSSRSASDPNPLPEFIEHAYKFLVANIFNPYPSRDEKQLIVDQTNSARVTLNSVSTWFTNARRRCGWTAILKERCKGNRETMVDLATRVFIRPDPQNPVDREVEAEFLEMREAVESMYERKTRTSAWIEDLDGLEELINPLSDEQKQAAKRRDMEEEREARKRDREMQKEQREFERQKRKMQAEALRKAERVTKMMERQQAKEKKKVQRTASFAVPYPPPQSYATDEESVPEPSHVAGGKRKLALEEPDFYSRLDLRQVSPAPSRSSSFISDASSSDGRVPSLTWSDSGDERPYKRSRSAPYSPPSSTSSNSPRLSPSLEIPASFDYSFTFEPPTGLTSDPSAFDSLFDFSVNPCQTLIAPTTPVRGQKRPHDEDEDTPRPKRVRSSKPVIASAGPDLISTLPSTPLFTPTGSLDGTPTQGRRLSIQIPDLDHLDAMLGLGFNQGQPQPVQIAPPDASVPLEMGVYDWSSDQFDPAGSLEPQADYSQLLQLFQETASVTHEYIPPSQPTPQLEVPSYDLAPSVFLPQQHVPSSAAFPSTAQEDLSGLMSGLMSEQALNDMGIDFAAGFTGAGPATPPDLSRSRSPSVSPPAPVTPANEAAPSPTPAELANKALKKERKRRMIEEQRAALERERARLAELEREAELEDD